MNLRIGHFLEMRTVRGEAIHASDMAVTPVARILSVSLARRGVPVAVGFTWARPVAVEVRGPSGTQRLAIVDPRMWVALGTAALAVLAGLAGILVRRRGPTVSSARQQRSKP